MVETEAQKGQLSESFESQENVGGSETMCSFPSFQTSSSFPWGGICMAFPMLAGSLKMNEIPFSHLSNEGG